jgi:hypothetical protein
MENHKKYLKLDKTKFDDETLTKIKKSRIREQVRISTRKYREKLAEQGKKRDRNHEKQYYDKIYNYVYKMNAILCIKYLFGQCRLI